MSAFLGPVHHWLFNKIRLHEELEDNLIDVCKNKYKNGIEEIASTAVERYGEKVSNKPLDNQIDLANIHHWLQSTIGRTETRLAYFLAEVFRKHGDEAVQIALSEYKSQGKKCGENAMEKGITSTAPQIYKALNDYILEGMPCDRANVITENSDDKLQWKTTECLHRDYWIEAGADLNTFYTLKFEWIKAFVNGSNPNYEYNYRVGDNIDSLFVHEIKLKQ